MQKNRVAIYVRVSTLHQIDKDSLPMQKKDLLAYAQLMLDTDDCVIFEDAGYSGKNTDRPAFQKMLNQMRQGLFTHLLVWKIDRISRNLLDFAQLHTELKSLGVTFISKNEQFDTSSAMGEAMLKIILVFAELERNMTSERVTAAMISRASNGQWNGGRVPYGYDYDVETSTFTINDSEADIVRQIYETYKKEISLIRVCRLLNNNGFLTRANNQWTPTGVRLILRNVFYVGDYQYNRLKEGNRQKVKSEDEWVTIPNHHPAIISRELQEHVCRLLDKNKRLHLEKSLAHKSKHIHIFSSLLICEHCDRTLTCSVHFRKKDKSKYTSYICPTSRTKNCVNKTISDPALGEFVINFILNLINAQKNLSDIDSAAKLEKALLIGSTFSDIDHIENDGLADLFDVLLSGKITDDIYKGKFKKQQPNTSEVSKLKRERKKLERALERLRTLYLFSESSMSEKDYVLEQMKITEQLDEINTELTSITSADWNNSVSDEEFIYRASQFILTKKLDNRNYINFKRLVTQVDENVLYDFFHSVIDNIKINKGKVNAITFKNGLSHVFIYKKDI